MDILGCGGSRYYSIYRNAEILNTGSHQRKCFCRYARDLLQVFKKLAFGYFIEKSYTDFFKKTNCYFFGS